MVLKLFPPMHLLLRKSLEYELHQNQECIKKEEGLVSRSGVGHRRETKAVPRITVKGNSKATSQQHDRGATSRAERPLQREFSRDDLVA